MLITGLSGVGKTSVLDELARRGYAVADTDYNELSVLDHTGGWVWDLDRVGALLDDHEEIFISGTSPNWRPLLSRFDHVVLLSAPPEIMITRLRERTNNPYGRMAEQRAEAVAYKETVEPLLRNIATIEIDTTAPLEDVVGAVLDHCRS